MIELKSVNLRYPLMGHSSHSFQCLVYNKVGGVIGKKRGGLVNYIQALHDINIRIEDGQRLGIIGHNGAGKTTLLRVLSGVYPPTSGEVICSGKISSLIDFTLGMDPNANGLKNIVFRLVFMGFPFKEAQRAVDEIVEFSELGEFIYLPVRTYSTGMFLRLAFAISTHFTPDILILDEVIGAGDESFRSKARKRLDQLINKSRIVVLSSHDLEAVKAYCDTAVLMKHGRIRLRGNPNEVVQAYIANPC